ncbi:MAG: peptide ABC transporter permease [Microvirga sp.]
MARVSSTTADPAAEAAALLRRVGFATLILIVPTAALVTRRGLVVLIPIGVFLIAIAAAIDGAQRPVGRTAREIAASPAGIAAALALAWCVLSLLWTPFPTQASERLLNIGATLAMALVGYLALPDRMRSANLYLIPVGIGIAALVGCLVALFGAPGSRRVEVVAQNLDRGLTVLALLVWPGVAWLRSRGRHFEALAVGALVGLATVLGPQANPAIAFAIGAVAFVLTVFAGRLGVIVTAWFSAGLLALAPLIPFVLRPIAGLVLPERHPFLGALRIWRAVIVGEPERLITGHGFETALRGRLEGLLPANAPSTILFELWYELGVVGALAAAAALLAAILASGRNSPSVVPGMIAAFATAYAFACLGIGTAQMWWFTALALVVLVFVSIERGQFRTTRPKARLFMAANDR